MAALALHAELSEMNVVTPMTGSAILGELHLGGRLPMAIDALRFAMRASQRKASLFLVVEFPRRPAVGRVAGGAIASESAFVNVVLLVAANAFIWRALECLGRMALRAAHQHVHAEQREIGQIVIETDVFAPSVIAVAGITRILERAAVRVFRGMASLAIGAQLLLCDLGRMAGVAIEFCVCAQQFPLGLHEMIVLETTPAVVAVAARAILAEASCMRVVGAVATNALVRNFVLELAGLVATATLERVVPPQQRKAGLFRVVELARLPVGLRMTLGAVIATRATVHVVGRMAGDTASRRAVVLLAKVARIAAHFAMGALQCKVGLVVIEAGAAPGSRVVASATLFTELASMQVFVLVTGAASRRRIAQLLGGLVT